jgi:hypothetical protein
LLISDQEDHSPALRMLLDLWPLQYLYSQVNTAYALHILQFYNRYLEPSRVIRNEPDLEKGVKWSKTFSAKGKSSRPLMAMMMISNKQNEKGYPTASSARSASTAEPFGLSPVVAQRES